MNTTMLFCRNCGSDSFTSRNRLFSHLRTCLLDRNPKNFNIISEEAFFKIHKAFIYVTGGRVRGKTLNSLERYDCQLNSWENVGFMSEHRGSHASVIVESVLYVLGGGGLHSNLNSGEKIDCFTLEKGPIKPMISFRHAVSVVLVVSEKQPSLYAIGGWEEGVRCCHQVERYDICSEEWRLCCPMPTARRLFGAVAHELKIYCFGGNCEDGVWDCNVLEILDTATDTWSLGTPVPIGGQTSAVLLDEFIYVIAHGQSIFRYDPIKDSYVSVVAALPLQRWYCFDVTVVNQEIYFHGGNVNGKWSKALWKYHPYLDRWTELASMNKVRRRCAAAALIVQR